MMDIQTANDTAIVSESSRSIAVAIETIAIDEKTMTTGVSQETFGISSLTITRGKSSEEPSPLSPFPIDSPSPPPSLDLSLTSTVLSSIRTSEDWNDSSSSVSSQESSTCQVTSSIAVQKTCSRSVFSQYWRKTGQKPIPIRSMRSPPSFSSIAEKESEDTATSSCSSLSYDRRSQQHHQQYHPLLTSATNADLLENDDIESTNDDHSCSSPTNKQRRRRSILPVAPVSHPALKKISMNSNTRSWRKSRSMSSVPDERTRISRSCFRESHSTRSMPRMTATTPNGSCLRPHPRYSSPNRTTKTEQEEEGTPALRSSPEFLSRSTSSSSIRSTDTTSSSVSFLDTVDVRHFETPRETYAQKGWSEYFK